MYKAFDYSLDFKTINFRVHPELYIIGKGEQGVLLIEPYKSEILQFWRFKTPKIAEESAKKIYALYLEYKVQKDFVGMDMARKFLQMGITRSRRYANHLSGKKFETNPQSELNPEKRRVLRKKILPIKHDPQKAQSADIFSKYYYKVRTDPEYQKALLEHKEKFNVVT